MENKQATHHWFTTNLELIGLIYSSGFGAYVQYKAGLIADAGWGWGGGLQMPNLVGHRRETTRRLIGEFCGHRWLG
jgi:hypothetical protein